MALTQPAGFATFGTSSLAGADPRDAQRMFRSLAQGPVLPLLAVRGPRFARPQRPRRSIHILPRLTNKSMKLRVFRNSHAQNANGVELKLKPVAVLFIPPTARTEPTATRIHIHKVRFEFVDSTAGQVCVAGTFNDWRPKATPMLPMGDGGWQRDLGLPPNIYEYCFVVDGVWMADPRAKETVPNPFGGMNSILKVGQCNAAAC